jgi:hypothetical protein
VRQFLILMLGCMVCVSWPLESPRASDAPDAVSEQQSRPMFAANAAGKPAISELIGRHSHRLGIDPNLVHAVVRQESGFNPRAVSPKGAMGLMQLMPETAASMGVSDPFDSEQNIIGGIKYLRLCLSRFDGDLTKALAAYNAGPLNVEKYDGCPPFAETRDYVARVMRVYTGQEPLVELGPGRFPPGSTHLSPAALAVLRELNPYRYTSSGTRIAEQFRKPLNGNNSKMSPSALAVLKELAPYRYRTSDRHAAHRQVESK